MRKYEISLASQAASNYSNRPFRDDIRSVCEGSYEECSSLCFLLDPFLSRSNPLAGIAAFILV